MSTPALRRTSFPVFALGILLVVTLHTGGVATGASEPVDWNAAPTHQVNTTQGSFLLTFFVQLARDDTDIYFRVSFDYPVAPDDPEMVYFAVELDKSGRGRPMAAGNEMIIVSRKGPSGQPADHFSYLVEQTERSPVPAPTNIVTLDSFAIVGSRYIIEFHRPLQTTDTAHYYQFKDESSVLVDFAVSEWGIGRAHSYTSMVYVISLAEGEVLLTRPAGPAFEFKLTKETANLLGQTALILTFVLIGFHVFRRRVWDPKKYHPWLGNPSMVEVERHSLTARVTHVIHLGLLLIFVATGWSMLAKQPIFGGWTLTAHMVAAFIVIVNIPLHFVALFVAGEWKTLVRITRDDITVAIRLALNFIGLSKEYPEHVTYDGQGRGYFRGRKYCSYQKLLLWGDTLFFLVMGLTGFALYYPGNLDWLQAIFGGRDATLAFHDLFFYLLTSTVLGHFYFSAVPANWSRMASMVSGTAKIPVHLPESGEGSRDRK